MQYVRSSWIGQSGCVQVRSGRIKRVHDDELAVSVLEVVATSIKLVLNPSSCSLESS